MESFASPPKKAAPWNNAPFLPSLVLVNKQVGSRPQKKGRHYCWSRIIPNFGRLKFLFIFDVKAPRECFGTPTFPFAPFRAIISDSPKSFLHRSNSTERGSLAPGERFFFGYFLAIFRNEITTILTPSTSEGGEWVEVGVVTFFVLEVPDYESAMLIYFFIYIQEVTI